ncbi:uncharacterized protein LOC134788045 [Penaeus indicus]|uniref:uncharacterized protein LOC134788045 n=1 Tax=Penaeus indicus TaxID=29960 RepID=UPI00300D69C5
MDNFAAIHSQTDGQDSIIVFLDSENAFELANQQIIVSFLPSKDILGKLLSWSNDYFYNRQARVKYQGHFSEFYTFENVTSQGGILSPFLFSILVPELISLGLPSKSHLLTYANNLQLISVRRARLVNAQPILDLISRSAKI